MFADPESPLVAALPAPDPTDPESLFRASQTMASILQFIWPLPDKGLSKRLYRLTAPTLLVWGAQDGLVHPAYGEDFQELIAGSRLEVVDGAGHIPQLEQAEATIGLITDFLCASLRAVRSQLSTATPTVSAAAKQHHTK